MNCDKMKKMPPDKEFNQTQLRAGTRIELEHTKNKSVAKTIAKAHLMEHPDYYKALRKMETQLKKKKK